ncbi:hypothetical protein CA833_25025 [Novosphingobium sp. KA1]|nr:hypothetical protein CA833_25025 [Novosphingobium sp. KA1]
MLAYTDDGRLEIDNDPAENALWGIAVGRKNWIFAGADCFGEKALIYGPKNPVVMS